MVVLNLIINGIPSIPTYTNSSKLIYFGFKPYYKWNTFNTFRIVFNNKKDILKSFKPYYKWNTFNTVLKGLSFKLNLIVLNLIINGIPSIQLAKTSPPIR